MTPIKIIVDSVLRIPDPCPPDVVREFKGALEIPNDAREQGRREHTYGWQHMPEVIPLWRYDSAAKQWILPRGYAHELFDNLDAMRIPFSLVDARQAWPFVYPMAVGIGITPNRLRPYQKDMVNKLLKVEQGVLEAPPGSGKTVASLELIRKAGQKALVIVDKTNIAEQWRERSREFLGYVPGLIGDGTYEEREITVALVQTLWSRQYDLLSDGFFKRWGLVLLDECHHVPARTFTETMQQFPAFYRFGVSATPESREGSWALVEASIGQLAHRVTKGDLRSLGVLVSPKVFVHQTGFKATYFPTHKFVNSGVCDRMGCTRPHHKKIHRNNYTDIVGDLATDWDRSLIIARNVINDYKDGRAVLVVSSRKSQLQALYSHVSAQLGHDRDLYMLTGDQDTAERMNVASKADFGQCVIFSTIADEALDIPRLDALHLPWPTRNTAKIRQQLGRVERTHKDKRDAIVHDYSDDVGPLRGQLADRFAKVYVKEGMETRVPAWLRRS